MESHSGAGGAPIDGHTPPSHGIPSRQAYILSVVTKRLVEIDDDLLDEARAQLGTATMKDTVNEALRQAGTARREDVARALDVLGGAPWSPRENAWR